MATQQPQEYLKPGTHSSNLTSESSTDSTTQLTDGPCTGYMLAKNATESFLDLERSDYQTAAQHVAAFHASYIQCRQHVDVPPFIAAVIMLRQIHDDSLAWVDIQHAQYHDRFQEAHQFKTEDLTILIKKAIDHVRRHEVQMGRVTGFAATATKAKRDDSAYHTLRNQPPPDERAEWVHQWLRTCSQKDKDGNCGFCGLPGHGCRTCPHLVPEVREPDWKPVKGVWVNFLWHNKQRLIGTPLSDWKVRYDNRILRPSTETSTANPTTAKSITG